MMTVTATFDLTILWIVAANVVALLVYVLIQKHRVRAIGRDVTTITKVIGDYFRDNGGAVGVECISRAGGRRFVALISSRPSKRFRNSHIVEIVLATHVRKVCGLELEKVYWCFPLKTKQDAVQRDTLPDNATQTMKGDDYFAEGPTSLAKVPSYRVKELTLEKYEELVKEQLNAKEELSLA